MKLSIVLLIALSITFCLSSCSNTQTKYLSPDDFVKAADLSDTSIHGNNFIGASGNRVYLEHSSPQILLDILGIDSDLRYTIFWTEFKEIPTELINKLQKSKSEKQKRIKEYKINNI